MHDNALYAVFGTLLSFMPLTSKKIGMAANPLCRTESPLCAIHHRAFDSSVLGIRPDYVVEIRADVMEEKDGPTLLHALQGLHHADLQLPRSRPAWPRQGLLEERYERFKAAS